MSDRNNKGNMSHPFPTNFLFSYLNATTVANDAFISDSFIFSAMALIIFYRSKYPFAE